MKGRFLRVSLDVPAPAEASRLRNGRGESFWVKPMSIEADAGGTCLYRITGVIKESEFGAFTEALRQLKRDERSSYQGGIIDYYRTNLVKI